MGHRPPHRGFADDIGAFGHAFITTRLEGFLKDIEICLTDTPNGRGGITHAYFPALATCCAFLEYMTALERGGIDGGGRANVARWAARYLPQPAYGDDPIRVLIEAFRNSVAHRGIATGIWCDRRKGGQISRRVTWMLSESRGTPALQIVEDAGRLTRDPPWPCVHTHRMQIYLRSLADDLAGGARSFAATIRRDPESQRRFRKTMLAMYPP